MAIATVVKTFVSAYGDVNAAEECTPTVNTSACFKRGLETLAVGANVYTVPTGAKTLTIEDSTVALTVKGVTGDAGVPGVAGETIKLPVIAGNSVCITAAAPGGTALFTWC